MTTSTDNYIDTRWAWYTVMMLFLAYTCSFIDRTILALLVEPIKRDLHLSDTQLSLLHGFAFALFYTFMGIPISRLADQYSRRLIIGTGIVIWSFMTAVCGLTKTFWQLFFARVGVGVGEAALSPAAYSLISDCFPPKKLGRALALYSSGIYVGAGLAFIIGGAVIQLLMDLPSITLPVFGEIASWQAAFFIVGIPGLFLAVLVFSTLPEPARHEKKNKSSIEAALPFSEVIKYVKSNWRVYSSHFLGYSMNGMVFGLVMSWGPTYFIRTFGLTASEAGYKLGIIIIVFGTAGMLIGGWLADKFFEKHKDSMLLVGGLASLIGCPLVIIAPLMPDLSLSLLCYALLILIMNIGFSTAPAALQLCTPNRFRAQASAVYLFFLNVIAIGIAPTAVALFTDYVLRDEMKLNYSIAIIGGIAAVIAGISLLSGRKYYAALVEENTEG